QGWTCFQGDNDTVSVEMIDSNNQPIAAKYSYQYPYMVPHGTPIDSYSYWPRIDEDYDMAERKVYPFIANGIEAASDLGSSYEGGLETRPQVRKGRKSCTGAHGLEIVIPAAQAKALHQRSFKIEAKHRGKTLVLQHLKNKASQKLPESTGVDTDLTPCD